MGKPRIVILGGGVGAMAAAFALTDRPDWRDDYESITVYQLGWRLGGKGASGRNARFSDRIEEHGLHVWFGFYENAFRMMRRCFWALEKNDPYPPLDLPVQEEERILEKYFERYNWVVLEEKIDGGWHPYRFEFPENNELPGRRESVALEPWDYLLMLVGGLCDRLATSPFYRDIARDQERPGDLFGLALKSWDYVHTLVRWPLERLSKSAFSPVASLAFHIEALLESTRLLNTPTIHPVELLRSVLNLLERVGPPRHNYFFVGHNAVVRILDRFLDRIRERLGKEMSHNPEAHLLWVMTDLAIAAARGMLRDGVVTRGFEAVDRYDFGQWLKRHGASKLACDSTFVRAVYGLAFAFRGGDPKFPRASASAALVGLSRLLFTCRGSLMWKMKAGMGDTIFAPLYQVLRKRNVEFRFFHRVRELLPSDDGHSIAKIVIGQQAHPATQYPYLRPVKGRLCWPNRPSYDLLKEAKDLKEIQDDRTKYLDFESYWSSWDESREETITLKSGKHFDHLVLGISLGALPVICGRLATINREWAQMFERLETVPTQAFQLWLKKSVSDVSTFSPGTVMTGFIEPIDTWGEMSLTLDAENWTGAERPEQVAYFCGAIKDRVAPPWFSAPDFPKSCAAAAYDNMKDFVTRDIRHLWPRAMAGNHFDWDLLLADDGKGGEDRLSQQFWVANFEPTERYVLSLPGTLRHRLRSDRSGFDNLLLAGDWTRNGMSSGCVEAAVMSGFRAAKAISKRPIHIVGEENFD